MNGGLNKPFREQEKLNGQQIYEKSFNFLCYHVNPKLKTS